MSNYGDVQIKSSSKFLKIESGAPQHLIRLLGDALERTAHGFGEDEVLCAGENCPECASGSEPQQRFRCNVYDHNLKKVMVWNYTAAVGRQLQTVALSLHADKTDITDVDLKISASGQNMQKKHLIMPWVPAKIVPPGLKLYDLRDEEGA